MASEGTQININDLSFNIEGKTLLHNTNLSLNGDGITVLLGAPSKTVIPSPFKERLVLCKRVFPSILKERSFMFI